jgi:DtxR family Mn-dependent transcriptional regulator
MAKENTLTRSLEDYLEAILLLERKNRVARVKDIAHMLDVQMPSVTGALKNLKKRGFINYEKNSFISLTDKGLSLANSIEKRHTIITDFLETVLFLPHEKAEEEACKIEHVITPVTTRRLKNCTEYIEKNIIHNTDRETWVEILDEEMS